MTDELMYAFLFLIGLFAVFTVLALTADVLEEYFTDLD